MPSRMFAACASCSVCEGFAKSTKLADGALVVGDLDAPLLIVGGVQDLLAYELHESLITEHLSVLLKSGQYSLTFGVRCMPPDGEMPDFVHYAACGVYTRFLINCYRFFMFTKEAWDALGFDVEFKEGKSILHKIGYVGFIKPITQWSSDDYTIYNDMIFEMLDGKATKTIRKDLLK